MRLPFQSPNFPQRGRLCKSRTISTVGLNTSGKIWLLLLYCNFADHVLSMYWGPTDMIWDLAGYGSKNDGTKVGNHNEYF